MRRYSFAELGERDHDQLVRKGKRPAKDSLNGRWRIDVVGTSNHATPVTHLRFVQKTGGKVGTQCEPVDDPKVLVPGFVADHFSADDSTKLERELRRIDDQTMVGTWNLEISSLYAKFVAATPGLFRRNAEKSRGRTRCGTC